MIAKLLRWSKEKEEYLKIVKKSVDDGRFIVCTTPKNEKNRNFIRWLKSSGFIIKEITIYENKFEKALSSDANPE